MIHLLLFVSNAVFSVTLIPIYRASFLLFPLTWTTDLPLWHMICAITYVSSPYLATTIYWKSYRFFVLFHIQDFLGWQKKQIHAISIWVRNRSVWQFGNQRLSSRRDFLTPGTESKCKRGRHAQYHACSVDLLPCYLDEVFGFSAVEPKWGSTLAIITLPPTLNQKFTLHTHSVRTKQESWVDS